MSGHDKKYPPMLNMMRNRVQIIDDTDEVLWNTLSTNSLHEYEQYIHNTYPSFPQQQRILMPNGGPHQQQRMIFDKRRSLDRALFYSYQGANIRKVDGNKKFPVVRALINPNKLKQDYDDKIISVHKELKFQPGDVFEWMNTNTYWLIYLQDLTELAYFRGDIRKCSYQINWIDENGEHSTYAAVRGPVETKIDYIQKHKISVDNPNYSLHILLPNTEETLKYFQRYAKFYLQGEQANPLNICWRVEAIDWISTPGILEINAVEYYSNETEDDIEKGLVGGLIVKEPEPVIKDLIDGEKFIKPKKQYTYKNLTSKIGQWSVSDKAPVKLIPDENNRRIIHLKWESSYSGQFDLSVNGVSKTIVVESLF